MPKDKVTSSQKLDVSHIYQLYQTSKKNEIAIASYNGLLFVKIQNDINEPSIIQNKITYGDKHEDTEKYFQGEFVNKILEYRNKIYITKRMAR